MDDKAEFMDLMDIYSMIDEEKDDDELISYLGVMHPIKEAVTKLDDKVIYCQMMNTTYGELPRGNCYLQRARGNNHLRIQLTKMITDDGPGWSHTVPSTKGNVRIVLAMQHT